MKKVLAALTVVAVLSIGVVAFAHGGPGYGGHMGYGPGYGYGGHMGYGPGYGAGPQDSEFLEKTADLRRQMHEKRFEYSEAYRAGDKEKAEQLAGELDELRDRIHAEAPRGTGRTFARGPGYCW